MNCVETSQVWSDGSHNTDPAWPGNPGFRLVRAYLSSQSLRFPLFLVICSRCVSLSACILLVVRWWKSTCVTKSFHFKVLTSVCSLVFQKFVYPSIDFFLHAYSYTQISVQNFMAIQTCSKADEPVSTKLLDPLISIAMVTPNLKIGS